MGLIRYSVDPIMPFTLSLRLLWLFSICFGLLLAVFTWKSNTSRSQTSLSSSSEASCTLAMAKQRIWGISLVQATRLVPWSLQERVSSNYYLPLPFCVDKRLGSLSSDKSPRRSCSSSPDPRALNLFWICRSVGEARTFFQSSTPWPPAVLLCLLPLAQTLVPADFFQTCQPMAVAM